MRSPILSYVVPIAAILLGLSILLIRWSSGRWRKALRIVQMISGVYLLICLLAYLIPTQVTRLYGKVRAKPQPASRELFQGIRYIREVRTDPPMVIHIALINLDAPGIRFIVTPPNPV